MRNEIVNLDASAPGVPCGHEEDALRLFATGSVVAFCQRCERGYDAGLAPVPA